MSYSFRRARMGATAATKNPRQAGSAEEGSQQNHGQIPAYDVGNLVFFFFFFFLIFKLVIFSPEKRRKDDSVQATALGLRAQIGRTSSFSDLHTANYANVNVQFHLAATINSESGIFT